MVARSRRLQLDAALDRMLTTMREADLPQGTVTLPSLLAELRADALGAGERRRAARDPDPPAPRPRSCGAAMSPDLARGILALTAVAEAALATGEVSEISSVPVPEDIIRGLRDAAACVDQPAPGLPTETGLAEGRALAQLGRAGVIRRDLRRNDLALGREALHRIATGAGLQLPAHDQAVTARGVMVTLAGVAEEEARRERGIYSEEELALEAAVPPQATMPSTQAHSPLIERSVLPAFAGGVTASTLLPLYLKARSEGLGKVLAHTNHQDERTIRLFVEVCGDRPFAGYGRRDLTQFLAVLRRMPASHGKSPRRRGMAVGQILAEAESSDTPRLSEKTVKRHASAVSQFLQYAVDQGELTATARFDIVSEHAFHLGDPREDRDVWTMTELQQLFGSPVWKGSHQFFRSRPGPEIIRDGRFWLPLLALFQGSRLEELADLRRKDVILEDGVYGINITDEHRKLKTHAAKRRIPIHPEILKLGFIEFVSRVAKSPKDPLFPELKPSGADRKRGPRITRWFAEYRKEIGIYRDDVASHAMRHLANTRLRDRITDKRQLRHLDYMFGHSPGTSEGETRYDKGPPLRDALETLQYLRYPELNLAHLYMEKG